MFKNKMSFKCVFLCLLFLLGEGNKGKRRKKPLELKTGKQKYVVSEFVHVETHTETQTGWNRSVKQVL